MWIWLTVAIVAVAFCTVFSKTRTFSKVKNWWDGMLVRRVLGKTAEGEQYVLHDLTFTDGRGEPCKIDHVYINRCGIWVIKREVRGGQVFGERGGKTWILVNGASGERSAIDNPLKQNGILISHLSKRLHAEDIFHNVLCLVGGMDASNIKYEHFYSISTLKAIKAQGADACLTAAQMERYYRLILQFVKSDVAFEVAPEPEEELQIVDPMVCPKCGGRMVRRKGKYGEFFGCSSFPDCRYTRDIMEIEK